MNEKYEQDVPLNWVRRAGRPTRRKLAPEFEQQRIPRITRLMALAIKFQDMVDRGEVRDYADIARLGYVTRARLTQIMNLSLLAPDIQEQILLLVPRPTGLAPAAERSLRRVSLAAHWEEQRQLWANTGRGLLVPEESRDPQVDGGRKRRSLKRLAGVPIC